MKKTFFSKLLVGAIAIATIGFVSCKDYDDDINNLQDQINKAALVDDVTALKTQLKTVSDNTDAALSTAQKALSTADNAATAAALAEVKAIAEKAGQDVATAIQKANDAAAAAANAQTTADGAKTAADGAKAAADAAQSTANDAKTAAQAAQDAANKAVADAAKAAADAAAARAAAEGAASATDVASLKSQLEAQLKTIGELQAQLATANALAEKVKNLEQQIAGISGGSAQTISYVDVNGDTKTGTVQEAINASAARVAAYQASVDAIWSAVTSVSLYYNASQNGIGWGGLYALPELVFIEGEEKENVFPAIAAVADGQFTFTNGRMVTQEDSLVIRVSPVNAKLQANQITLINSQGKTLDTDLVKVLDVHPFVNDGAPLTRGVSETGLWTVVFKLVDGYDVDKFAELARYKTNKVVFAVGINNTLDDSADRLVVSEYDVTLKTDNFTEAYSFNVNGNAVEGIHNRWIVAEDQNAVTNDPVNHPNTYAVELNWLDATVDYPTPWTSADDNNSVNRNAVVAPASLRDYPQFGLVDYDDNRNVYPILSLAEETIAGATVYQDIHIVFPKYIDWGANRSYMPIKGFYVTLDQDFAVESKPSEINAWRSYAYENVGYKNADGTYVPAHLFTGNEGTIAVKNLNGVKGDIIGFRVYAVNIDGTLYDPDGRAFYVRLGEVVEKKPLAVDVLVLDRYASNDEAVEANFYNTEIVEVPAGFFQDDLTWTTTGGVLNQEWAEGNPTLLRAGNFVTPVAETSNEYMYDNTTKYTGPKYAASHIVGLDNNAASTANAYFNVVFWDNVNNQWTATPDANTTKVKASINVANTVRDNETYSFKLMGYNEQYQGGSLLYREMLQEITVNIKKVMPTDMSGILTVKTNQLGEAGTSTAKQPLRVFMKPAYADGTTGAVAWNVNNEANVAYGQDILPFDLADIFNGLQTPLKQFVDHEHFRFTFHDSDIDANGNNISTNSTWNQWQLIAGHQPINTTVWPSFQDKYSYFVPNAYKAFVNDASDEVEREVDVNYDFKNISLKENVDGTPLQEDFSLTIPSYFKVIYRCALTPEMIFRMNPNHSNTQVKANAGTLTEGQLAFLKTLPQLNFKDGSGNAITYGDNLKNDGTTSTATLDQARANVTKQFTSMAYEGNGIDFDANGCGQWKIDLNVYFWNYNATSFGTTNLSWGAYLRQAELPTGWNNLSLASLITNNYLKIDESSIKFYDTNNRADYYQVTDYQNGVITLTNTRANERPSLPGNVNHTLSFNVVDVFGHSVTISETVTMLKPVTIQSRQQ